MWSIELYELYFGEYTNRFVYQLYLKKKGKLEYFVIMILLFSVSRNLNFIF